MKQKYNLTLTKKVDVTKSQSQLIEYALETLLNDDDFVNLPEQATKDMKTLINKFFDLTKTFK